MIKLINIYNTYTYIPIYIQLNTHIYMQIKKHKQSKKLRLKKKYIYIYIKKRSMYNMIHANQRDIHWPLCGCALPFQFGINLLI